MIRLKGENQNKFLSVIDKIYKSTDKHCFMCAGTLLGYCRDKKIIPWDNDIDLGVLEEDLKKEYINNIKKEGFKIQIGGFNNKELGFLKKINLKWVEKNTYIKICLFVWKKGNNGYRYANSAVSSYSEVIYGYPEKYIIPLKEVSFKNINIKIPFNSKEFLKYNYGNNWIIPIKNWNNSKQNKAEIKRNGIYKNGWTIEKLQTNN
jgi:phosphorylcholine metabolism protein LicD